LTSEFESRLIALEYYSSGPYACPAALNIFDKYYINYSATPQAVFNGNAGSKIIGGGPNSYTQYKEQITKLLEKPLSPGPMLRGKVVSEGNRIRANVTLENLAVDPLIKASLYAVIYESVAFSDGTWHNVVKGVTPAISVASLGIGESASYQLQSSLEYNNHYGVVIILTSDSGQIIQAYKAR
jgi:hypothetical protein